MTSAKALAHRRQELITIISVQRTSLVLQRQMWQAQLGKVAFTLSLFDRMRKNPLVVGALVLGIILIKPRRILGAVQQSSAIWQRIRVLLPLASLFLRASKVK